MLGGVARFAAISLSRPAVSDMSVIKLESGSSLPDYDKRRTPAEAGAPPLALVLNTNRSFDRRSGAQWPL
jgi:hypothetical protein